MHKRASELTAEEKLGQKQEREARASRKQEQKSNSESDISVPVRVDSVPHVADVNMADLAQLQQQLQQLSTRLDQLALNPPAAAPVAAPAAVPHPPALPPIQAPLARTPMGDRISSLIQSFHGSAGEDFLSWLRRFEQVADSCGLNDANKIKALPAYLLDAAFSSERSGMGVDEMGEGKGD